MIEKMKMSKVHGEVKFPSNRSVALNYAKSGIPVFPCVPDGPKTKKPLTKHGHHDASCNVDTVSGWWDRWSDALVGIPTGPESGVWVLDVDGPVGLRSLRELLAKIRVSRISDLTKCVSRTPSGGLHLLFQLLPGDCPRNRASDLGPGLDTRGVKLDGSSAGYFIAAGSRLPCGRAYELLDDADIDAIGGS